MESELNRIHHPIKMLATDVKTQKIEPDPKSFMTDGMFQSTDSVCKKTLTVQIFMFILVLAFCYPIYLYLNKNIG